MNGEQHEMVLDKIQETGAEEWFCPVCGRRMLVKWSPKFRRIVLETGDDTAMHSGSKGGLHMSSAQARPVEVLTKEVELQESFEEFRLLPWIQWLEESNFEDLWNKKNK